MAELTVITYGFGDLLWEFFNAVVATMGESTYSSLIRISVLLAVCSVIMGYVLKQSIKEIIRFLGAYYLAIYILFIPTVTVHIDDRINEGTALTVDNVPLGLGAIASFTSQIGSALTEIIEKNFSMPDDPKYSTTGMVMASNLLAASSHFQITDPEFAANMRAFTKQCVFYDLYLGKYTKRELFNTKNIWSFVKGQASPLRAFMYRGASKSEIVTCKNGVALLEKDWETAINEAGAQYGSFLFGKNSKIDAKAQLFSYLGNSYSFLLGVSDAGSEILRQNLMATTIIDAASASNPLAMANSYSYAKAQMQQRLTHRTIGEMAAHWLPLMNSVFQAIMYGSFIFILVLTVLPAGLAILKNYVYSLMWLQLWAPLFAIINLIVSYYAQARSGGMAPNGFTLSSMSGLAQINSDMAGLAGYMSMSVPFLSAGIVKGMSGVFTSISQYVGGVTQSAAGSAAAEATSGNLSLGNTSFSTHSANNTSANHFNTSGSMMSGGFSRQLASGSIANITPGGGFVLDNRPAVSSLATKLHTSSHLSNALSQHAEQSTSAAESKSVAFSEAHASAFRKALNLATHQDKSMGNSDSSSVSASEEVSQAANHVTQHIERLSKDYGVSEDVIRRMMAGMTAEAGYGAPLSGLTGVKAGITVSGSINAEEANKYGINYSDFKQYAEENNLNKSINTVERAAKDHQFRANTDEGKRLVADLNSSYEKSDNLRNEVNSNLQKANSYRESANFVKQNAATIDYQEDQRVVDWLKNQNDIKNPNIKMTQDNIDYITRGENRALTDSYVNRYIKEEGIEEKFIGNIQSSNVGQIAGSPEKVQSYYNHNSAQIQNQHSISSISSKNDNQVNAKATASGLDLNKSIVDHAPEKQADQLISQSTRMVQDREKEVKAQGNQLNDEVQFKTSRDYAYIRNEIRNKTSGLNMEKTSNTSNQPLTFNPFESLDSDRNKAFVEKMYNYKPIKNPNNLDSKKYKTETEDNKS